MSTDGDVDDDDNFMLYLVAVCEGRGAYGEGADEVASLIHQSEGA